MSRFQTIVGLVLVFSCSAKYSAKAQQPRITTEFELRHWLETMRLDIAELENSEASSDEQVKKQILELKQKVPPNRLQLPALQIQDGMKEVDVVNLLGAAAEIEPVSLSVSWDNAEKTESAMATFQEDKLVDLWCYYDRPDGSIWFAPNTIEIGRKLHLGITLQAAITANGKPSVSRHVNRRLKWVVPSPTTGSQDYFQIMFHDGKVCGLELQWEVHQGLSRTAGFGNFW